MKEENGTAFLNREVFQLCPGAKGTLQNWPDLMLFFFLCEEIKYCLTVFCSACLGEPQGKESLSPTNPWLSHFYFPFLPGN